MYKFIKKISIFSSPILFFIFFLEYNLTNILNTYNYKKSCIEKQLGAIEVLVLGSSHASYGINPDFFYLKAFNLSNVSQSLFYDYQLTLKYLNQMPNLKYVIITVSYFSFGYQLIDGVESWRDFYYSHFWGVEFPELNKFDLKRYSKIFLYSPKISLSYMIQRFNVRLNEDMQANGFIKIYPKINNKNINDSLGIERVKNHNRNFNIKRLLENKEYLELLIKGLKKKHISVILITPPVFSTYYKYIDSNIYHQNQDMIYYICKNHNCVYYNYFMDKRFSINDFMDNDHLNSLGAEKLSKILNDVIH